MPSHLQNHDDKSGESNRDKITLDNIYIDDCSISASTEDELREMKAILPDILRTKGIIAKAPTCEITRDPVEHSSSGFINTASIIKKAEYSSIADTDDDSDRYIKDNPFPSIVKDSKKAKLLTAKLEENQNTCQDKETIASGKAS